MIEKFKNGEVLNADRLNELVDACNESQGSSLSINDKGHLILTKPN